MNFPAMMYIYFGLVLFQKTAFSKKELKMAILDEKRAPLVAMLNMTDVGENIQAYVDDAIKSSLYELTKETVKEIVSTEFQSQRNSSENNQKLAANFLDIEDALQEVEMMSVQMRTLKKKLNTLSEMKEQSTPVKTTPIAFTAILSQSISLGDEQIIRYDEVITNVGNAYHAVTGIFLVPISGIYSLSVGMMAQPSNSVHIQLMRNGNEVVRLYTQTSRYVLTSQAVNVDLIKNDRVWVQKRKSTGGDIYGGEKYNVFSGVLIHAT